MMKMIDGLRPEQMRELRHAQARELKIALQSPLQPVSSLVDPLSQSGYHRDEYGRLAEELFSGLLARMSDSVPSGATLHGFRILTRILSYAPDAYKAYRPDGERTVEELHEISLRSGHLATKIADMDNSTNKPHELHLGLSMGPQYSNAPLTIETKDGLPVLEYDPEIFAIAEADAPRPNRQEAGSHYRKCPALGFVLASVWETAANECATRPELFPAALGQEAVMVD